VTVGVGGVSGTVGVDPPALSGAGAGCAGLSGGLAGGLAGEFAG
jgi:hypothetical protein